VSDRAERALDSALAAEHAAVYAYGVLGPRLPPPLRPAAASAEVAHRARRDATVRRVLADGRTPPPAAPAYTLPFAARTASDAVRLAIGVEERTAATWREAVGATAGVDRTTAVAALTDAAVRAARWRKAASAGMAATTPFPGSTPG